MKKALLTLITFCLMITTGYAADIQVQRATGGVALASTLAPGHSFELLEVNLHLGAASATAENFTATVDAYGGAAYDVVIYSKDMNTITNVVWRPEPNLIFSATDEIDFAWANTNTETYGLEIRYRRIQ